MNPGDGPGFDTLAVHAGTGGADTFAGAHPIVPPIVHAASFWYDSSDDLDRALGGEQPGPVYQRNGSPTVAALEDAVSQLERAESTAAFGSGMAAIHAALLACAPAGSLLFASADCYGGTASLLNGVLSRQGVRVAYVDIYDVPALSERLAAERPSALIVEVLSNPLQRVADVSALAAVCERAGCALVVDSTFTSPYLVRPLEQGARYVIHSATKYLSGHGDAMGGTVSWREPADAELLRRIQVSGGAILGPMEAYLVLRGIRTLGLRLQRQCANAETLAAWLAEHPRIERVFYPGLPDAPDHALARSTLSNGGFGAMLAFAVRGAVRSDMLRLMERLRIIRPAPSLGDCASLASYPPISSHRGLSAEQRQAISITDNILRLSVGIEAVADLEADLAQALA